MRIRSPAVRLNHEKTTRLRNWMTVIKNNVFIAEAWSSATRKSNGISRDEVFAEHGQASTNLGIRAVARTSL